MGCSTCKVKNCQSVSQSETTQQNFLISQPDNKNLVGSGNVNLQYGIWMILFVTQEVQKLYVCYLLQKIVIQQNQAKNNCR